MSSSKHFQVAIDPGEKYYLFSQSALDELIAFERAAEREACAKVCEELWGVDQYDPGSSCADAIRARGNVSKPE